MEWKKLGEVCNVGTGKGNRQDEEDGGKYPFYVRSKEVLRSNTYLFDEKAVIIPGEGGVGEIYHYIDGKYNLHQRAYRIAPKNEGIIAKYVYYYMTSKFKRFIESRAVDATVKSIRKPMVEGFSIPIPSLEEQAEIVAILDQFDTLTNSLTEGIPAEIELRQKQYEFYREKLLTF